MTMSNETALILASLLLLASMIVPWFIVDRSLWVKAAWRLAVFVFLTILVQRILDSPFAPQLVAEPPGIRLWEQVIEVGWWVIAAQGAIGITRLFLVFEAKPRETRIVSDLIAAVIHLVALFGIIDFVFAVPIGGLLATSGVIAIVLGLALQSSLADVFSGIAVGIERPYSAGDLVWVEGGVEGRVIQINWRSTHIATINHDVAIVPNSVMAKSRLINHSLPTPTRAMSVSVRLAAGELPERCLAVLTAAVKTCMLMSDAPAPSIARTEVSGDGVKYEIGFSIPNIEAVVAARTELLGHIQNHLRHAGISLAVPGIANVSRAEVPAPAILLKESDWFGILAPDDRNLLSEHLSEVWYATGDKLIQEGEAPEALFIIASGTVEISASATAVRKVIHRLGPGGSLGAIGMITGTPYAATAEALTPVTAYRLDKKAVGDVIALRPELVSSLEVLARRGRDLQRTDVAAHDSDQLNEPEVFLSKLRGFLRKISETPHR
ncbi:mechanosensitive ion channel family protein [Rhizobium tumorigenes]|uniref:Small-conductance mechanosensitive channel n=1 Tax=Rhizobium tumorigenes TaxID=2041385 RepID=A0AAF1K8T4_9HYPH|nr:mechanosensitive ion channel family protein [Rhizobium tumorigenes]WFR97910.1 mechanosensitive ion channel family protein [Rhizobium tumorigenes]